MKFIVGFLAGFWVCQWFMPCPHPECEEDWPDENRVLIAQAPLCYNGDPVGGGSLGSAHLGQPPTPITKEATMRFSPSTIVPSDFEYFDSFDLGGGEDRPFNTGPCTRFLEAGAGTPSNFEDMGKCCVCGTRFRYGEVWRHGPSDLRIAIGHRCATKYGLLASNPEYDRKHGAHIAKMERIKERRRLRRKMREFLTEHPEVRTHLRTDHRITKDLRASFIRWGSFTEKQMELLAKLTDQVAERAREDEDRGPKVPVPEFAQRRRLTGRILGIKWQENNYAYNSADVCKMLWEIQGEGGRYTLWGTLPDALADMLMKKAEDDEDLRGVIRRLQPIVSMTVGPPQASKDDPTFGFYKRPTKPELEPPSLWGGESDDQA